MTSKEEKEKHERYKQGGIMKDAVREGKQKIKEKEEKNDITEAKERLETKENKKSA